MNNFANSGVCGMHTKDQLWKMPLSELEKVVAGAHPGSAVWSDAWPVYEIRRRRLDSSRTWICFVISTAIGLTALIRTFLTH
jgi:hypothetical protein